MVYEFYSGSYAKKGEDGIVKFSLDTGKGTLRKLAACTEVENPSYLAFNKDKTVLYAVSELSPQGAVCDFAADESDFGFKQNASHPSEGADPCQLSLDKSEDLLFCANYSSGSLAVFKLTGEGFPAGGPTVYAHPKREDMIGANPERQEAAHVHYARECGAFVYVADLGRDEVFVYAIERDGDGKGTGVRDTGKRIPFGAGTGPRHLEFLKTKDAQMLYTVCELANEVDVFKLEGTEYVLKQVMTTRAGVPAGTGSIAAAIKKTGDLLLTSNRGDDTIAVYRIRENGLLEYLSAAPAGGRTPRDFSIFGDYVVIANQDSDRITVKRLDRVKGELLETGISIETVKPVCIRGYRAYEGGENG